MEIRTTSPEYDVEEQNYDDQKYSDQEYKKQFKKSKFSREDETLYKIVFEDESAQSDVIMTAVTSMRQSSSAIDAFFKNAYDNYSWESDDENAEFVPTGKDIWDIVAQEMYRRSPSCAYGKNIFMQYSFSVNSMRVKFGQYIGFDLNIRYRVEEGTAYITRCTAVIHVYNKNNALINSLLDAGFEKIEKRNK